ncbi:hypothetical protein SAMN05216516_11520 [Izhakiella capsodis]|uniref:Uncharacterized protein n=1 Tax=Izhakiella capsodis TaxID=1367852 RepID=A0A1I5B904_9GAMM|nr:hypothetical protein SAMN05216516_11520 [Izhakiella capsodis]
MTYSKTGQIVKHSTFIKLSLGVGGTDATENKKASETCMLLSALFVVPL